MESMSDIEFMMPYSAPMIPVTGTSYFTIPTAFQNATETASLRLWVPPGISTVRLTWDGPEPVQALFGRRATSVTWRPIIALSAGTLGQPRSGVAEVSTDIDAWVLVRGASPISISTIENGFRAGLTVIPM